MRSLTKYICAVLAAAMLTICAGCSVNSNDSNSSKAETSAAASTDGSASEASSAGDDAADTDDGSDASADNAAQITLDGSSAKISDGAAGVTADGSTVTITAAGDYTFTGTLDDGQILVNAPKTDKVDIYFNNVTVSSSTSAPIRVEQADGVTLHLMEGTVNTFADSASNSFSACISAKDDLTIKGKGTLKVTGSAKHAIKSSNDVKIKNGVLELSAVGAGVYGEDKVQLTGGSITIVSCKDGIKSVIDEGGEAGKGIVTSENTTVDIQNASGNGIEATTSVTVKSGSIRIHSAKQAVNCDSQTLAEGTVEKY